MDRRAACGDALTSDGAAGSVSAAPPALIALRACVDVWTCHKRVDVEDVWTCKDRRKLTSSRPHVLTPSRPHALTPTRLHAYTSYTCPCTPSSPRSSTR